MNTIHIHMIRTASVSVKSDTFVHLL